MFMMILDQISTLSIDMPWLKKYLLRKLLFLSASILCYLEMVKIVVPIQVGGSMHHTIQAQHQIIESRRFKVRKN